MYTKLTTLVAAIFLTMTGMAQNAWYFQFRAKTMSGTTMGTSSLVTWTTANVGFNSLGTLDLSSYLCEGDQFKLENLSYSGTGNTLCTSNTNITSSTLWDAGFGDLLGTGHPQSPFYPSWVGTANLQNDAVWPASPGLTVTVPIGAAPTALATSTTNANTDPNYVFYMIGISPVMGCRLTTVNNNTTGGSGMLYMFIKVKRSPKRLTDVKVCPNSTVTNTQLGITSGVTATSWSPYDPRTTAVNTTTTFTCTLSNGTCTYQDQVLITVNQPQQELFTSQNIQICNTALPYASTGDIFNNPVAYRISVNGTLVFDSSIGNSILNSAYFVNNVFVVPGSGTTTVVYEYYVDNYTSTCSKTYTVYAEKNDISGTDFTICQGSSGNLAFTTGSWPVNVYLNSNGLLIGTTYSSPFVVTPGATTTYTIRNSATALCPYSEDQVVATVINLNPDFTYSYTVTSGTATLTAAALGSGSFHTWEVYQCTDISGSNPVLVSTQTTTTANFTGLPTTVNGNTVFYKICHTIRYLKLLPCPKTTCKVVGGTQRMSGVVSGESLEEESGFIDALVFPNPTNGKVSVTATGGEIAKITVYNALGAIVFTTDSENGRNQSELDLSNVPSGVYLAHITVGDQLVLKRIVKE